MKLVAAARAPSPVFTFTGLGGRGILNRTSLVVLVFGDSHR
jgi:hypothetical protein